MCTRQSKGELHTVKHQKTMNFYFYCNMKGRWRYMKKASDAMAYNENNHKKTYMYSLSETSYKLISLYKR